MNKTTLGTIGITVALLALGAAVGMVLVPARDRGEASPSSPADGTPPEASALDVARIDALEARLERVESQVEPKAMIRNGSPVNSTTERTAFELVTEPYWLVMTT